MRKHAVSAKNTHPFIEVDDRVFVDIHQIKENLRIVTGFTLTHSDQEILMMSDC